MIKSISTINKTEEELRDFVFKLSPFSDIKSEKFLSFWKQWYYSDTNPRPGYMAQLKEMDKRDGKTLQRYFLCWSSFDSKTFFAGTTFIDEAIAHNGLDLSQYEPKE